MQNATLHIKVKPEIAEGLKLLSKFQGKYISLGKLPEEMGMNVLDI
jgi:hypothetical protein